MKIIALYSKSDFLHKFKFVDANDIDYLFSKDFSVLFKKYDYYIIPNSATVVNVIFTMMLFSRNIIPYIFVDSILEPLHLSWWKRWKRFGFTGAYQMVNKSTFHPLNINSARLPIPALSSVSIKESNSNFRCLGITVPNTVSYEFDQLLQIREYYKDIISHCELNGINYRIRDRNNFFKNDKFFLTRILNGDQEKSLDQFFSEISHLITSPGSLVLQAGINDIIVCQIINTFLFTNTPSAYIVTIPCPVSSWINKFLFGDTPNHIFQRDYYYHLFGKKSNHHSLKNLLASFNPSNSPNDHQLASPLDLFVSFAYWHLRLLIKNFRNRWLK